MDLIHISGDCPWTLQCLVVIRPNQIIELLHGNAEQRLNRLKSIHSKSKGKSACYSFSSRLSTTQFWRVRYFNKLFILDRAFIFLRELILKVLKKLQRSQLSIQLWKDCQNLDSWLWKIDVSFWQNFLSLWELSLLFSKLANLKTW